MHLHHRLPASCAEPCLLHTMHYILAFREWGVLPYRRQEQVCCEKVVEIIPF